MRELLQAGQSRHHLRTVAMAALVTLASRRRRLPDRLLRRALCPRPLEGAVLSRRHAAAVVELSGQGLCLEADPRQGRHPDLAVRQAASALAARCLARRCRSSAATRCRFSYTGTFLVFVYVWLPFMILPMQAALERVPGNLIEASADLGASPGQTFRNVHLPAGAARHRRRLDLHLLADARRLHHPADRRHVAAVPRPGRLYAAGHGRQHPARRRLHRGADRHHGPLPLDRQAHGGLRCALTARQSRAARPEARRRRRPRSSCICRCLLIFLYAFTTEEKSYQSGRRRA